MLNCRKIVCSCCVVLLVFGGVAVRAYEVNTYNGTELKWPDTSLPVVYYINENGTPDCSDEFAVIHAAYAAWENVSSSYMDFASGGMTPSTNWGNSDGMNLNIWIENNWAGITGTGSATIGLNRIWFYTDGRIIDSDIAFNGEQYTWSSSGASGRMDIQNIATHEIGHSLSLADLYGGGDSEKTMYGYASTGETKKRTLHSDDVAGISYLYPNGGGQPDTEPPTMEPIVELEGAYYSAAPAFSNFGFDDNGNLNDGWFQLDSYTGAWTPIFSDVNGTSWDENGWTIPGFTGLSEGSHQIYFKADDDEGNTAGTSGEWRWCFFKDTTRPTIVYHFPGSGSSTHWYAADPGAVIDIDFGWISGAPLDYAAYRAGDGHWLTIFTVDQSSDYTQDWGVHWTNLAEGEHEISIMVVDKAGNERVHHFQRGVQGFTLKKDTELPMAPALCSETHPSQTTWYNLSTVSLSWSPPTDLSGITGYSHCLDRAAQTTPDETSEGTGASVEYTNLPDGLWYVHCRAMDRAGQWGATAHYALKIDVTDPDSPEDLSVNPDSWTNVNTFTVTWNNPQDASGIAGAYCGFDILPPSDTGGLYTVEHPLVLQVSGEGVHTLYLWLQDQAGNVNRFHNSSVTMAYDGAPPTGGAISIGDGVAETDTHVVVLMDLKAVDDLSGVALMQFSNDGETWSSPEPYDSLRADWDLTDLGGTMAPGLKTVSVRYGDVAGNWSDIFADDIRYSPPLKITTTELRTAVRNEVYATTLEAIGGSAPYTWSVVGGSLPQGLNLSVSGEIYGAPTSSDTLTAFFTVQVIDSASASDRKDLSIQVCDRIKGDVNGDGKVDILDTITIVNQILGGGCVSMEGADCWAADWTNDGHVDIIDVLNVINFILGQSGPTTKDLSFVSTVMVIAEKAFDKGSQAPFVIISTNSPEHIAAAQFIIYSENENIHFDVPELTSSSQSMTIASGIRDGMNTILLYSPVRHRISPGLRQILRVPFSIRGEEQRALGGLHFETVQIGGIDGYPFDVEIVSGLGVRNLSMPEEIILYQNYPNPFNPNTIIEYALPAGMRLNTDHSSQVTLKIYNILGQEVRTLVDEVQTPGSYSIIWDGRDNTGHQVVSGFYFCRLTAGDFMETKRMVLMK